jgi:hypothetical protein
MDDGRPLTMDVHWRWTSMDDGCPWTMDVHGRWTSMDDGRPWTMDVHWRWTMDVHRPGFIGRWRSIVQVLLDDGRFYLATAVSTNSVSKFSLRLSLRHYTINLTDLNDLTYLLTEIAVPKFGTALYSACEFVRLFVRLLVCSHQYVSLKWKSSP